MDVNERFWSKVDKGTNCWLWSGFCDRDGYGRFKAFGRNHAAHRWAFESANGPIPMGLVVDHRCHTPGCVNPEHLRLATNKQNGEHRAGAAKNNLSSGVRGVTRKGNRWQAKVQHNGKAYYCGLHRTIAEAEAAAVSVRAKLFTFDDATGWAER